MLEDQENNERIFEEGRDWIITSETEKTTVVSALYSFKNQFLTNSCVFFQSGAFVVLKSDFLNSTTDPPIWKIDGKALLQKYIPFVQDGKTLYKNTSVVRKCIFYIKLFYYLREITLISFLHTIISLIN